MDEPVYRIGVFNDVHGPWHDPRALSLTLDIFQDLLQPDQDEIWINGDLLDFYNINAHGPKSPNVLQALEDELMWGHDFFADMRKRFPKIKIKFRYGNHEWRLDRYITNNCKPFWNILTIDKQFDLDHYDIETVEYNKTCRVDKTDLYMQHSPPSYAKNCAMTSLEKKSDCSYMFGCTHRMDFASKTGRYKTYYAWSNGWLGSTTLSPEHFEVFRYTKGHDSWQQCASIITVVNGTEFFVTQFSIDDYSTVVDGYLYRG